MKPKVKQPKGMPDSLSILGQEWSIKYVDNLLGERNLLGLCAPNERLIMVDVNQAAECMVDTIWHEAIHAALSMGGVSLTREEEESIVYLLTPALISIMRTNKRWW